jgi:hypothetical protein
VLHQRLTGGGQHRAVARSVEQGDADLALEDSDLLADGAL